MAEYVIKISQIEFLQELERTPSVAEQIAKLDVFIGKLEERNRQRDLTRQDLDAMEEIVAKMRKELDEENTDTDITLFRNVRQNLIAFSSLPSSNQYLAPPPESSNRPPIEFLALPPPTESSSRFFYPPPTYSFTPQAFPVPPPTAPWSFFYQPPPPQSFAPLPPPELSVPPPTAPWSFFYQPPPPQSFASPPAYSLPPPELSVPPPTASWRSNFPWVSSGLPISGPQPTWGPLHGPIPPVQGRLQGADPRYHNFGASSSHRRY